MTHQELIDSAASYALDALDSEERALFEKHLVTCPHCQSEVAAYREVAGALAHVVPTTAIPRSGALRDRILGEAATFSASPSGRTATILTVRADINDGGFIDHCALTVEPTGGSPQPTETPRAVGSWRRVD
jgi:anti-sigma-K factor RskA